MPKTIPRIMRRAGPGADRAERRGIARDGSGGSGSMVGGPTVSGITVTPAQALTYSAVYAAINVISRDFAVLPPNVNRRLAGGGMQFAPEVAAHELLNREPNPNNPRSTSLRFRQSLMAHTLGWGNGYAEILRNGGGFPTGLDLLHPSQTRPVETPTGALRYQLNDGRTLAPENVFHLAGLGFDGVCGYSPIGMARSAIGLGKAAEQFGESLFGNGAIPKGYVKLPHKLTDTARAQLRQKIYGVHQGSARGNGLMLLDPGYEWVNTQINPDDAQFLATRAFQILEIARIFSMPPHKLGDYSQSHLANVEESNLDYLTTTITGWVEAFEAEANLKLLSSEEARTLYIECDMSRMMRGNTGARVAKYTSLRNLGVMNANEIRASEGMNPLGTGEGGELYLVQTNLTTLTRIGQAAAPEPAAAPTAEGGAAA